MNKSFIRISLHLPVIHYLVLMKKLFLFVSIYVFLISCCRETEKARYFLTGESKSFSPKTEQTLTYTDANGKIYTSHYYAAQNRMEQINEGGDGCYYFSAETNESAFSIEDKVKGAVNVVSRPENAQYIYINIPLANGFIARYIPDEEVSPFYNHLKNVVVAGFQLNNVIVFTYDNPGVDTVIDKIYLSASGIEFVLYKDGSWLKRTED